MLRELITQIQLKKRNHNFATDKNLMSKKKRVNKNIDGKVISVFRNNPRKIYNHKQIASKLEITDTMGRNAIVKALSKLASQKIIKQSSPGKYGLSDDNKKYIKGPIEITASGNGYLILPEGENDIFISQRNINRAFNGDIVSVYEINRKKSGKSEGEVVEVLERKEQNFVGILERRKDFGFVNTRGNRMYTDFFIQNEELKDYKDGDKVIVKFKDWPKKATSPFGIIEESLGKPGDMQTEMHAILYEYGLPSKFPEEVEAAANKLDLSITEEEIKKRRDFRDILTFTIDPITAKDFDDAISFKKLENNKTEIGIHIADVSHYITPDTILEDEALSRATSVYLVDRVVPMLPEILSNGACSLRPNEEKYTFSSVFIVNEKMEVEKEWFGKTVINSDKRFSYEEVQYILDSESPLVSETVSLIQENYTVSDDIFNAITNLDRFAKILREKRMRKGALSFDRVEIKFNLDKENNPESVFFKSSQDAHKLVEEFMLLANRKVAEFIGKQKPVKPFVYRIHDLPDEDKLMNLKGVASKFGYDLNLDSKVLNKSLNKLLSESSGQNEQQLIDTLAIRCMSKAVYTTKNIGHYGLAFEYYTHFTSPIRRYPDVMVHRLLASYLSGSTTANHETIEEACHHSSQREILATKVERDSVKYMQVKFMQDKIDQAFEGVISGVTDRGIYVEIIENKCEGLVRVSEIKGDYYNYDNENHCLVGEKYKKVYQLGGTVTVALKKADLLKRQLDFILVD